MGSIWETWRFRTAKFFPFGHPKRLPQWEALGRHGDSELLLNHFVMMSTMATTAAILIFSRQFMTWSVDHGPSLICMSVSNFSHSGHSHTHDGHHGSHLESLQFIYLLPNYKSYRAETLWKAFWQHENLELLKWFCSDIQDGHHGSHLENLQITSAPER